MIMLILKMLKEISGEMNILHKETSISTLSDLRNSCIEEKGVQINLMSPKVVLWKISHQKFNGNFAD